MQKHSINLLNLFSFEADTGLHFNMSKYLKEPLMSKLATVYCFIHKLVSVKTMGAFTAEMCVILNRLHNR